MTIISAKGHKREYKLDTSLFVAAEFRAVFGGWGKPCICIHQSPGVGRPLKHAFFIFFHVYPKRKKFFKNNSLIILCEMMIKSHLTV